MAGTLCTSRTISIVGENKDGLLHQQCSQLGRNSFFEARPGTIHFAGFEVGRTVSTRLDILNVSVVARRLHLVVPQTPQFRVRMFTKKGQVAPGMVEASVAPQITHTQDAHSGRDHNY
mmetsp:Transcript_1706/g.5046  ORF Transcript_1706/g.5046 Transcript_1706/m.5046 type:complete len:118 (+) Transcript_1706:159-512(+)